MKFRIIKEHRTYIVQKSYGFFFWESLIKPPHIQELMTDDSPGYGILAEAEQALDYYIEEAKKHTMKPLITVIKEVEL